MRGGIVDSFEKPEDAPLARTLHNRSAMNRKALELQDRTQRFAAAVIAFCSELPATGPCHQIVVQLIDAANATDSNYRATCRARSPDEFIAKVGVAAEEADESKGWLELLVRTRFTTFERAGALIKEADELTAIFVSSRKTAEFNQQKRQALKQQLAGQKRTTRRK